MAGKFPEPGPLQQTFDASAERPEPEAVKEQTPREDFSDVSKDRLKGKPAKPAPTLTPNGAPPVRGTNRQTVAEKNIDPAKLPKIVKPSQLPRKNQFERAVGRHRAEAQSQEKGKGRERGNEV